VAEAVGVPLSRITMDARGTVIDRKQLNAKPGAKASVGQITIPLPEEAIEVGHVWSVPHPIDLNLPKGGIKKIQAVQKFKLLDVQTGVATIHVSTQILTPITDPALESQLIEHSAAGTVRFDVDAGRVLGQQMDLDKHCVGFRGDASSLHYLNRFTERLLPQETAQARATTGTVER
jgi:hypothetical protein